MVEKGELPIEDVRSEVDTFMFEGHDTTSAGMNWALLLLANHMQHQQRVHSELDGIFGVDDDLRTPPTMDDLNQMKCLAWL